MDRDDWYRAQTWDEDTESAFEARLRRSRSGRSQYLKIQGLALADSPRPTDREVARSMFARVIEEFEDVRSERMFVIESWGALGSSLRRDGFLVGALQAFERYRELVDASGRPSTSPASDNAQVELLLQIDTMESLDRAAALIELQSAEFEARGSALPIELFRHAQLGAKVADRRGDHTAGEFARLGLRLSEDRSDPFRNHPGFGAIRYTATEIDELHGISERHPSVE